MMSKLVKLIIVVFYVLGGILSGLIANSIMAVDFDIPLEFVPVVTLTSIIFIFIFGSLFLYIEIFILQLIAKAFGVTYKKWLLFAVSVVQIYISVLGLYFVFFTYVSVVIGGILAYVLHKELNVDNKRLLYVTAFITIISLIFTLLSDFSNQMLGLY